jgi:hypothetical protein
MIVLNFENINYNNTLKLNDRGGINTFNFVIFMYLSQFFIFLR